MIKFTGEKIEDPRPPLELCRLANPYSIAMSSQLTLPTNFQADPLIQIRWNSFLRIQCEKPQVAEKHKECKLILDLWYDPLIKRLVPVESSSK